MSWRSFKSIRHRGAFVTRLLLIGVLVAAAFAHRPFAHPSGLSTLALAQYVLPDGSLPDLCLTGPGQEHAHEHCPFCLIAGSSAPPPPVDTLGGTPLLASLSGTTGLRIGPPICPACLATFPSRGPPSPVLA